MHSENEKILPIDSAQYMLSVFQLQIIDNYRHNGGHVGVFENFKYRFLLHQYR